MFLFCSLRHSIRSKFKFVSQLALLSTPPTLLCNTFHWQDSICLDVIWRSEVAAALSFMFVSVLIQRTCCRETPREQAQTFDLQIAGRGRRSRGLTLGGPFPDRESTALKEHVWFWYPLCCWAGSRGEGYWESSADHWILNRKRASPAKLYKILKYRF